MKNNFQLSSLLVMTLFISGCASFKYLNTSGGEWFEETYKPQIDKWTYDDVIKKGNERMRKEPVIATLYSQSRDIIYLTYSWGDFDGKNIQKTVYHPGSFLYNATSETETVLVRDGIRYSFVFDKNKILKWGQYLYYDAGSLRDSAECGDASFKPGPEEQFTAAADAKATKQSTVSLEQKLKDLQDLRDKKVITDEEYKKMREKALTSF